MKMMHIKLNKLKAKRKSSWPTDMSLSNGDIQIQIPCYQIATYT